MKNGSVVWGACVFSLLTACGGETGFEPSAEADVGEQAAPLFEQYSDAPVVDAILGRKNGRQSVYLVACGNDHKVYMRRHSWIAFTAGLQDWTAWEVVTDAYRCDGRPSVGTWDYSDRDSTVMIYWKDSNNHLIEAVYYASGSKYVTDLTVDQGLPALEGNPIVADVCNTPSAPEQLSVAMQINDGTRRLYTLDSYAGSWHFRPVLRANGRVAVGMTDNFVASFGPENAGWDRPYLAMQDTLSSHAIYSRSSWSQSYKQYASVSGDVVGAIALSGYHTPRPGRPGCGTDGCVYYRDTSGYVEEARLLPNGLSFGRLGISVAGRYNTSLAGGGPYSSSDSLYACNSAGHISNISLVGFAPSDMGGSPKSGIHCYLRECYYQGTDDKLYFMDQFSEHWNLGLNVLEQ